MPVSFALDNDPVDFGDADFDMEDREALEGLERLDIDSDSGEVLTHGDIDSDSDQEEVGAHPAVRKFGENIPSEAGSITPTTEAQGSVAVEKERKTLVDLPTDVLREIVKEVCHTNDLSNLALTCRCLHTLTIPHIYARFDIVWPDAATTGDRTGVDALTFGLATLAKSGKRGNDYARWIKKFSLGNGPSEWVSEYNINKEGGKMLGTLVEMAVAKMQCLETFSWDMPTGVLRDVFMGLHDLNGTLKNIHIRFHDNRETTTPISQAPSRRVESPTFKGFEGLRSLSVLDIDERQYLDEMSYAVEKSVHQLRELRVGLARHVAESKHRRWIRDWDDLEDTATPTSEDEPLGGVLGIIVGRVVDLKAGRRHRRPNKPAAVPPGNSTIETAETVVMTSAAPSAVYFNPSDVISSSADENLSANITSLPNLPDFASGQAQVAQTATASLDAQAVNIHIPQPGSPQPDITVIGSATSTSSGILASPPPGALFSPDLAPVAKVTQHVEIEEDKAPTQLKLETLELERVPISVWVLTKAIDWTMLQNLTILNCYNHERLWRALRRKYQPTPSLDSKHLYVHNAAHRPVLAPMDYKLRLKKLHTDCVTPNLLLFVRETLPPNSLETFFLQGTNQTSVPMDAIARQALRRHKGSLKKLLVDSKNNDDTDSVFKWMFTREHIAFVSSGKMPNLRELACAIDYKDWHYLLTRLPHMPHLRSLYITHTRDSPHMTNYAPRELAQQILNTVILRPEIELCYIGMMSKCFEVLEGPMDDIDLSEATEPSSNGATAGTQGPGAEDSDEEDSDAEGEEAADDSEDEVASVVSELEEADEDDRGKRNGIRLREILFYDDKVAVFRARTGKL